MKLLLKSEIGGHAQTYIMSDDSGDLYWNRVFRESNKELMPVPFNEVSDWYIFKKLLRRYYSDSLGSSYIDFLDKSRRIFFDRRPNAYRKTMV